MWNIDAMIKFLARVGLAAFVATMPIMAAPVAVAQMSANGPHGGIDCVPVGVNKDSDGVVWATEDCDGGLIHYQMGQVDKRTKGKR